MIANPEAANFILARKANLFKPTFPASKERILGRNAVFFHQGEYHARLRKLILSSFLPEAVRGSVPDIENIALDILKTWKGHTIVTYQEMKKVSHTPT
jgi:(+)-abscisic acid 8'-hydroxylase